MNYYFFISSLPDFTMDMLPPFSLEAFQAQCQQYLSHDDFHALEAIMNNDTEDSDHPFIRAWHDRETQIRNAIVRQRALRRKADPTPHLREQEGFQVHLDKAAADAFTKPSPLEREKAIDKLRWDSVEELAGFDPFTGRAVLAYTLKLLLARRWQQMSEADGKAKSEGIINKDPNQNKEETSNE